MTDLVATDLDGTYFLRSFSPPPTICISGRTWAEYDDVAKVVGSRMPLYIRGTGEIGDNMDAAKFKARMILLLGVTMFYEDNGLQAAFIGAVCPECKVVTV